MTKSPAPSDLADKFMLRMPSGMRERIKDAADQSGRSMNAEIVYRLEKSFPTDDWAQVHKLVESGDIVALLDSYRNDMNRTVRLAENSQRVLLSLLYELENETDSDRANHIKIAREHLAKAHPDFDPKTMPFFPRGSNDKPE